MVYLMSGIDDANNFLGRSKSNAKNYHDRNNKRHNVTMATPIVNYTDYTDGLSNDSVYSYSNININNNNNNNRSHRFFRIPGGVGESKNGSFVKFPGGTTSYFVQKNFLKKSTLNDATPNAGHNVPLSVADERLKLQVCLIYFF